MTPIRPIRNKADYKRALQLLEKLWGAAPGTPAHDRLEVLAMLIDAYEERRTPIEAPNPIAALRIHMAEKGYGPRDLARVIGSASRSSEVLHRRRRLTLDMVHRLETAWGIPASVLVKPYRLARSAG